MQFDQLKRREFFTVFGAAATWPLGARAQQPATPVIGFIDPRSPDGMTERLRGFRQGLKDTGYVEGETVAIEYRWAEGGTAKAVRVLGTAASERLQLAALLVYYLLKSTLRGVNVRNEPKGLNINLSVPSGADCDR